MGVNSSVDLVFHLSRETNNKAHKDLLDYLTQQ